MATPRIQTVRFDVDDSQVRRSRDLWHEVAEEVGATEEEINNLGNAARNRGRDIDNLANRTKDHAKGLAGLASTVKKVLIGGAIVAAGKKAIQAAAKYETLAISFETFLGSASEAQKVLKDLEKFSVSTPFTPEQVQEAGRALLAFGEPVDNLRNSLSQIGDIAAGTGKDFNELAIIYGKARVAGTLYAEDINQLVEAGVPIIDEFAKILNVSGGEVKKLASDGKIGFADLQTAFANMTAEGGRFNGLTDKLSKSTAGVLSTLQGQFENMARSVGQALLPAVSSVLGVITSLFDTTPAGTALFNEVQRGTEELRRNEEATTALLGEYDALKGETELNADEQKRLQEIINQLANQVPNAATAFDEYGNALDINTDAVTENLERQREVLAIRSEEALNALSFEVNFAARQWREYTEQLNEALEGSKNVNRETAQGEAQFQAYQNTISNARNELAKISVFIADNAQKAQELGRELSAGEQAFVNNTLGIVENTTVTVENTEEVKKNTDEQKKRKKGFEAEAGSIAALNAELSKLNKQITGTADLEKQNALVAQRTDLEKQLGAAKLQLFRIEEGERVVMDEIKTKTIDLNQATQQRTEIVFDQIGLLQDLNEQLALANERKLGATTAEEILQANLQIEELQNKIDELNQLPGIFTPEQFAKTAAGISSLANDANSLFQSITASQMKAIDEQEKIALQAAGDSANARAKIEEDFERKREALQRKQAERDKALAIFNTIISTAAAVAKALPNVPLSIFAAAQGALQLAAISAQPIPFFHGGLVTDGREDRDSVPAMLRRNEFVITPDAYRRNKEIIDMIHAGHRLEMPGANVVIASTEFNDRRLLHALSEQTQEMIKTRKAMKTNGIYTRYNQRRGY